MRNELLEQIQRQLRPESFLGILASMLALTLLAGHLYVLKPPLARYRELQQTLSASMLAETTEQLETTVLAIATAETEIAGSRSQLYGVPSELPLERMESYVIDRLHQISMRHGVQLVSVEPSALSEILMFDELPYDVDVTGTYFALFDWLGDVEEELRPMVVSRFEMRPEEAEQEQSRVAMKLRLVSYRPSVEKT